MEYLTLKYLHVLGAVLMGAGFRVFIPGEAWKRISNNADRHQSMRLTPIARPVAWCSMTNLPIKF